MPQSGAHSKKPRTGRGFRQLPCKRVAKSPCRDWYFLGASCPLQQVDTCTLQIQKFKCRRPGRRRGRYSDDSNAESSRPALSRESRQGGSRTGQWTERQLATSLGGGGNTAQWRTEIKDDGACARSQPPEAFIPVKFDPPTPSQLLPQPTSALELQHGATTVRIHWPLQASSQCAQWLREVLA
jgi:hypothetical protein